jgi:hypothetical protein
MFGLLFVLVTAFAFAAGDAKICFDAEEVVKVDFPLKVTMKKDKDISGAGYVEIPWDPEKKNAGRGEATYKFTIEESGLYYLWARTWWANGCGNSIDVIIDNYPKAMLGEDGTYDRWHWVDAKGVKFNLSKGEHTLKLLNRESGIRVDQFFLTQDRDYVPVKIRPVTQTAK